jgi:hypothetical protein
VTRIHHPVNRYRSFFATVADKIEIASEFVLIFNKFGPIMAIQPGASWDELRGKTGHRSSKAPERVMSRKTVPWSTRSGSFLAEFADRLHDVVTGLVDPYRPELHYMRGPGPKWHAKHSGHPVPVRVRAKR